MMDNTEKIPNPIKVKNSRKNEGYLITLIGGILIVLVLSFIVGFVYGRLSLNSSTLYPNLFFLSLLVLTFSYIVCSYLIAGKPNLKQYIFTNSPKVISVLVAIILTITTAQVAFTPIIFPRISFDRSATPLYGHIIGQTQYVGQILYFTIKPPLYPISNCVDVKLAYNRLVLSPNLQDLNPLITLYYTPDKSGNPTTAKICTSVDGWNVEDIKSSIVVEKEGQINIIPNIYYSLPTGIIVDKTINEFDSSKYTWITINLSNNEDIPVHIENYTLRLSNDSPIDRGNTWRYLLLALYASANTHRCINFSQAKVVGLDGKMHIYALETPQIYQLRSIKDGIDFSITTNLTARGSIESYFQAYLVDCPNDINEGITE